jgi:hypothetical protein
VSHRQPVIHIERDFFKAGLELRRITPFVTQVAKCVDESGYGFVAADADGPISATGPPPVLIVTNRPADAVIGRRTRTFDIKTFMLETGEGTRD